MRQKGESMIGILVAVAIVIVLAIVFTVGSGALAGKSEPARPDGKGTTVVGKALYRAKDEVCRSDLQELRLSIETKTDPVDNTHPQSLKDTGLGADFYKCPVGGEPYEYDPTTGKVHCVHPGHEKY